MIVRAWVRSVVHACDDVCVVAWFVVVVWGGGMVSSLHAPHVPRLLLTRASHAPRMFLCDLQGVRATLS